MCVRTYPALATLPLSFPLSPAAAAASLNLMHSQLDLRAIRSKRKVLPFLPFLPPPLRGKEEAAEEAEQTRRSRYTLASQAAAATGDYYFPPTSLHPKCANMTLGP